MIKEIASVLCVMLPSILTCMIYRLLGHNIGINAKIPIFSYVHADEIHIGNDVCIKQLVLIRVKKLSIGDNSILSFGTQIKGVKTFSTKGNNFVGAYCLIHCEEDVKLGFYSGLGPRCTVYTHGSFLPVIKGYPAKFEKVVFEDYVWIAMAVIILPGTYIESNCIINPGVVLKSRIKSNTLIEFNPVAFRGMDMNRLQKFLNKKSDLYYKEIIGNFLTYCQMDYEYNEKDNSFSAGDKCVFTYFPKNNMIELVYEKNKKIQYDLDNFVSDFSRLKFHKKFLFFLRRRYGVILGINY